MIARGKLTKLAAIGGLQFELVEDGIRAPSLQMTVSAFSKRDERVLMTTAEQPGRTRGHLLPARQALET